MSSYIVAIFSLGFSWLPLSEPAPESELRPSDRPSEPSFELPAEDVFRCRRPFSCNRDSISRNFFWFSGRSTKTYKQFVHLSNYKVCHLQLLLQELSSFRTVAAVAVHVDRAGGGRVVDQEDRRHNVLVRARTLHCARDRVVRDEMLHVLLQDMSWSTKCDHIVKINV